MTGERKPCPQTWHAGLPVGLLVECRFDAGHRGWHRNNEHGVAWGGKLTVVEVALAEALRAAETRGVSG